MLAKIQLVDNREVTELVVIDWMDYIGDLHFADAIAAVVRFRREQPGVYLEPGHIVQLVQPTEPDPSIPDIDGQLEQERMMRALSAAGVSADEFWNHEHDVEWLRVHFPSKAVEA